MSKWRPVFIALLVSCMALLLPDNSAFALKTLVIISNNNAPVDQPQKLVSTSPYDRQSLAVAPEKVILTFAQPVLPDRSYIRVYDMYGTKLEVGELESTGLTLSVTVPPLAPGKYKVKWRARCHCNEDSELGDTFRFTVQ